MKKYYYPDVLLCKKCGNSVVGKSANQITKTKQHPFSRDRCACKLCGSTRNLINVQFLAAYQCEKCSHVYENKADATLCEIYDFPDCEFEIGDVVVVRDRDYDWLKRTITGITKTHNGSCITYRHNKEGELYLVDCVNMLILNPQPLDGPPKGWNPHSIILELDKEIKVNKNGACTRFLEHGVYNIKKRD